ncbi:AAA family ATPase [Paenibacillus campi]|uniref:AAA family ATPase n=1 Tax=Paenibacillus campi TaxID=3106031 RepID=UPI002AFE099E|nr:AAA family ATPase [Paenibacillus sp. SGZ-1014]
MELIINNIGLINSAHVKLDGLTIIAGENDSGKSTIGKILFSVIKAINNYKADYKEDLSANLDELVQDFYFLIRNFLLSRSAMRSSSEQLSKEEIAEYVRPFQPRLIKAEIDVLLRAEDMDALNQWLENYQSEIEIWFGDWEVSRRVKQELVQLIEKLSTLRKSLFDTQENDAYLLKTIAQILKSEFKSDLNNKFTKKKSNIKYIENSLAELEITVKDNDVQVYEYNSFPFELDDVTYIESPFIFQMHKLITEYQFFNSTAMRGTQKHYNTAFPYHVKDLITKLSASNYYDSYLEENNHTIIQAISNIINGDNLFDRDRDEFVFNRKISGKDYSFHTSNVASGIKSFSVIQTLLKAYAIKKRSLLIIDEPEVHLHPEWQVKYCELIITLVESGVKVMVNSHSPYIIQALKHFSEKKDLQAQTHFYFATKNEDYKSTVVKNVDHNLNIIFKKLSDPLQKLIW